MPQSIPPADGQALLRTAEVAAKLRVTTRQVFHLVKIGSLPSIKLPHMRGLRFAPADVAAWVDAGRQPPRQSTSTTTAA